MNASPRDGDCEVVAGGFHSEGVVQELVLNGIVVIESQERVFPEEVGEAEEIEMERVIANDETVIGEGAQEHGLFARDDPKCFLDRLNARDQMGVRAGAADAREELWDGGDRLAFHGVRVESLEFFDGEFYLFHFSIFNEHVHTSRSLDLGEFLDTELAEFGYLMHRSNSQLTTNNKQLITRKRKLLSTESTLYSAEFSCLIFCFCLYSGDDTEFGEHFVDDGEEGGFGHGAALDAFVDGDDFVEFLHFFALVEAVEKKLNFVFEFGRERVSLRAWHAGTGAGADRDELFGLGADLFEFFLLLSRIDGAFDKGNVEFIEHVLSLQNSCMTDVEHFAPGLEVIVHDLGKDDGTVFTTRESEPTDAEFLGCFIHSTGMVA